MNQQWISFHLGEALEELQRLHAEASTPDFDEAEFQVGLAHAYHHLNTAWNSRHISDEEAAESTEESCHRWRQFPSDVGF